ncbi:carbon-nitrogen hydrolase family protein [Clostridium sp. WLY-B-L2]|uniref:Carbon-nitrogen hydrolase family protein n=1 Tax=Clostridium aromativorans TaxID=2836848 RepID=A0ABS8N7Q0_9CLOT|nr:carbon-nitrogen hydrolase family protein [Clostridium aromativorans]MCC9295836.1 carbon-nitrogen hydrolase family protein [Clostridium aromativorans]
MKIGLCQMMVSKSSKKDNLKRAQYMIHEAVHRGAEIVALPEIFNCYYNLKYFREYAESSSNYGETLNMLSSTARELGIYLIGGSIPEIDEKDNLYNTSFIFDESGKLAEKYRKIHLFDVNIQGKINFKESDILTPGNRMPVIDTRWGKIGVIICFDIRFSELVRIMALKGAKIIFVPAVFNMTTGPDHWETLFRSRAMDNQLYMVGISPARNMNYSYVAYGKSLVADPWGKIINILDEKEGILISELNLDYIEKVRSSLPILKNVRKDIYRNVLL